LTENKQFSSTRIAVDERTLMLQHAHSALGAAINSNSNNENNNNNNNNEYNSPNINFNSATGTPTISITGIGASSGQLSQTGSPSTAISTSSSSSGGLSVPVSTAASPFTLISPSITHSLLRLEELKTERDNQQHAFEMQQATGNTSNSSTTNSTPMHNSASLTPSTVLTSPRNLGLSRVGSLNAVTAGLSSGRAAATVRHLSLQRRASLGVKNIINGTPLISLNSLNNAYNPSMLSLHNNLHTAANAPNSTSTPAPVPFQPDLNIHRFDSASNSLHSSAGPSPATVIRQRSSMGPMFNNNNSNSAFNTQSMNQLNFVSSTNLPPLPNQSSNGK
jgi:hypothetical protein